MRSQLPLWLSAILCGAAVSCTETVDPPPIVGETRDAERELRAIEQLQNFGARLFNLKGDDFATSLESTGQIWLCLWSVVDPPDRGTVPSVPFVNDTMATVALFRNVEIFGVNDSAIQSTEPRDPGETPADLIFRDAHLESLSQLPRLRELYVNDTHVTDAGLMRLADFSALRFIEVTHTLVTDQGIADFRRLRPDCVVARAPAGRGFFYNRATGQIDGVGKSGKFQYAKDAPYVTKILIWCGTSVALCCPNEISGEDLQGLEKLTLLNELDLECATGIGDADIDVLFHLPNLRKVDLSYSGVSSKAVERLKAARPQLEIQFVP